MVTETQPGDVQGETAHPVGVRGDVDCGDHSAKIACHGRLPGQKGERAALDPVVHVSKLFPVEDDTASHLDIGVQQSAGCAANGVAGESAHCAHVGAQQV
jgi:hypothetical protein